MYQSDGAIESLLQNLFRIPRPARNSPVGTGEEYASVPIRLLFFIILCLHGLKVQVKKSVPSRGELMTEDDKLFKMCPLTTQACSTPGSSSRQDRL